MILQEDSEKKIQTFLTPKEDENTYIYEIFSQEESNWKLHAKGQILSTENKIIKANLNDIKEECNILVDTVEYYQKLAQRGVHLDTNFQAIKKLWKNKSEESLAEISLPEKIESIFSFLVFGLVWLL